MSTRELSLENKIVIAMRRMAQAIDVYSRKLLHEHGLTAPQLATLRELERRGLATPSELAASLHMSRPTMAGVLARLERQKQIHRSRDAADGRSVRIGLTALGAAAIAKAPRLLADQCRAALAQRTPQRRREILATLEELAEIMNAPQIDSTPLLGFAAAPASAKPPSRVIDRLLDGSNAGLP